MFYSSNNQSYDSSLCRFALGICIHSSIAPYIPFHVIRVSVCVCVHMHYVDGSNQNTETLNKNFVHKWFLKIAIKWWFSKCVRSITRKLILSISKSGEISTKHFILLANDAVRQYSSRFHFKRFSSNGMWNFGMNALLWYAKGRNVNEMVKR